MYQRRFVTIDDMSGHNNPIERAIDILLENIVTPAFTWFVGAQLYSDDIKDVGDDKYYFPQIWCI